MKKKIDFKEMPRTFTRCTCSDCERHETCLHWLAYDQHPVVERCAFYDPRWFEKHGGTKACTHYADSTPTIFAAGFQDIYDDMPKVKGSELRKRLFEHFGEFTYYRYRRGDSLMPPSVQEYIRETAKELGITSEIKFTATESHLCWEEDI